MTLAICTATDVVTEIASGRAVVALDGDHGALLFFAAETASTELLGFAIRHSSGLVHAVMRSRLLDRLRIPDQPVLASEDRELGFTVAVDANGVGTGISARDRALTLRLLGSANAQPADFRRPGHVLPVRCPDQPVNENDLLWASMIRAVEQAGCGPVAGACRLVHDSGDVLDETGARAFASRFGLAVLD